MKSSKVKVFFNIGIVIVIAIVLIMSRKESTVTVADESLKIGGIYGKTIQFEDVEELKLQENRPKILRRSNGISFVNIQKGIYRIEDQERARLFLHSKQGPYIVIYTANESIIINYKSPDKTQRVYEEISSAIEGAK